MNGMNTRPMFARWVFRVAGVTGLFELIPLYFLERELGVQVPPAITHPEFYYGFVSVAIVCQLLFFVIASDPMRYRPLMPIAVLEKLSYVLPCAILLTLGRLSGRLLLGPAIDTVWLILFSLAYVRTPSPSSAEPSQ